VREVIGDYGPSPASGISAENYTSELNAVDPASDKVFGVMWLVEPKRSSLVDRWSGTMQHPNYPDNKFGQTISAFAHFSLVYSKHSMVLVDLQSK